MSLTTKENIMNALNRRKFIEKSMMGLGSAAILSQLPFSGNANFVSSNSRPPVGFQVYTIREKLVKDFGGTLKIMADLGYQGVDYIGFIHTFAEKIYHVHMKDAGWSKIPVEAGVFGGHTEFGTPGRFWDFRSLGHGNIDFEEM